MQASPRALCLQPTQPPCGPASSGNLSFGFRKLVSVFDPEAPECGRMRWARGVDVSPAVASKHQHTCARTPAHAHACTRAHLHVCARLHACTPAGWHMHSVGRASEDDQWQREENLEAAPRETRPRVALWETATVSVSQQRVLGRIRADGWSAPGSCPLRT